MNRNAKGINMIYDYNHYNDPTKGNKHIYPYGVQQRLERRLQLT